MATDLYLPANGVVFPRELIPGRGRSPSTPRSHDPRPSTQPWRTTSRSPSSRSCFNCGKPLSKGLPSVAEQDTLRLVPHHFYRHRARSHWPRTLTWPWLSRAWMGRPRTSPWPGKLAAVRILASPHRATQPPGVRPKDGPHSQRVCALHSSSQTSVPCCVSLSTAPEELCETFLHGAPNNGAPTRALAWRFAFHGPV